MAATGPRSEIGKIGLALTKIDLGCDPKADAVVLLLVRNERRHA